MVLSTYSALYIDKQQLINLYNSPGGNVPWETGDDDDDS